MRNRIVFLGLLALLGTTAYPQCREGHDERSTKTGGWLVADLKITGAQKFTSNELTTMAGSLIGTCLDADQEDLANHVRFLFQNKGYVFVEATSVKIHELDALAQPKPIAVEVEITEGEQSRFGEIKFIGNHAFSTEVLRKAFPIKPGEAFSRDKVAMGLEKLRDLYAPAGYLDFYSIPDIAPAGNRVRLQIKLYEGPPYHMGKLAVAAKTELAETLRTRWQLAEGSVFDARYVEKYVSENHDLLPPDFTPERIERVLDCPKATVAVRVIVDAVIAASGPQPKGEKCPDENDRPEAGSAEKPSEQ